MNKRTAVLAALLALAATPTAAQESAKIGFVATFSGPAAGIGNDMRDGFELALDHLGRKVGGLAAQVIYEDDQQKPEVGKQKTDKLIGSDRVSLSHRLHLVKCPAGFAQARGRCADLPDQR